MSQVGHDSNSEHSDKSEKPTERQKNFLGIQHLFTLLLLLTPQAEENACEESAQSNDETTSYPAFRESISSPSIEPIQYPKHDYEDAPFSKEASEHVRSSFRRSLSDAQGPVQLPMFCHV